MGGSKVQKHMPSDELEAEVQSLADENRSLREYLARVLEVLESRLDDAEEHEARSAVDLRTAAQLVPSEVVSPVFLTDMERRLRRTEDSIEDLMWTVGRYGRPVAVR